MATETDQQLSKVHFVGIGGIGMSALAQLMKSDGIEVSGSDANESPILERLRGQGIVANQGHRESQLPKDYIIYQEYHALIVAHAKEHYSRKITNGSDSLLQSLL